MIYYFSGTGNSLTVAQRMAEAREDQLVQMTYEKGDADPAEARTDELGLVFPVYGWGLPRVVEDFVSRIKETAASKAPYVYAVLTCGDDIGYADRLLRTKLAEQGVKLDAVFSIIMRETYVFLPGFDVDKPESEKQKWNGMLQRLPHILDCISNRQKSTKRDLNPGMFPRVKTNVLRPLFHKLFTSPKGFRVDTDRCKKCGRCEIICPVNNITTAESGQPQWGERCTFCLACYHICPQHAIVYGHYSKGKGQVKVMR